MKPDPNNPDRVLMKDPNGKTMSKPKPNGFDEFWKKIANSILKERILCWELFWIKRFSKAFYSQRGSQK